MLESVAASVLPPILDRAVLVVNHVLRSQPLACERLAPHAGRTIDVQWRAASPGPWPVPPALGLRITPPGLVERVDAHGLDEATASLRVRIELPPPQRLIGMSLAGRRPAVEVDGDAQFAADVAWLADHLRWDAEHDLARLLGDAPGRLLVEFAQAAAKAVRTVAHGVANTWERRPGAGSADPR